MMKPHIYSILFLAAIFLASCGGNDPVGAGDTLSIGDNGFVLSGGSFARMAIDLADSTASAVFDSSKNQTIFTASGSAQFAKPVAGASHTIRATLTFTGESSGTVQWDDLSSKSSGSGLTLTIDSTTYKAVSGQTNIVSYANVGGVVSGTFSGSLKSASGEVITIERANFNGKRAPDKKGQSSGGYAAIFTINGDGYSNAVIEMPSTDGSYTANYDAANKYTTLMLLANHSDVPGHGSQAVSWIINYPSGSTGVQLWNNKAHSAVTLRIGDALYQGTQGATTFSILGTSLGTEARGSFYGTMQNVDTKVVVQVTSASFDAVHF